MGLFVQFLCSYVTLPLYALVTQMGSSMKASIFSERVAKAIRKWHHKAKKQIKNNHGLASQSQTPISSRLTSPAHPLRHYRSEIDSFLSSPIRSDSEAHQPNDIDSVSSFNSHHHKSKVNAASISIEIGHLAHDPPQNVKEPSSALEGSGSGPTQHEREFSFDNILEI